MAIITAKFYNPATSSYFYILVLNTMANSVVGRNFNTDRAWKNLDFDRWLCFGNEAI